MSLDWNIDSINNWDNSCYVSVAPEEDFYDRINVKRSRSWYFDKDKTDIKKCMNPITDALIYMTMTIDLGSITEDNIAEWQFRIWLIENLEGEALTVSRWDGNNGAWKDCKITKYDLRTHVGLSTNVSNLSRSAWIKKVFKRDHENRINFKNRWKDVV